MDLTREYFDEALQNLAAKSDLSPLATTEEVAALRDDLSAVKGDVTALKDEVGTLKEDVATVKADISSLHTEFVSLKSDVREIKETLDVLNRRDLEDSNAFARDIVRLQKDVEKLKLSRAS
ncbi:MAG: hypothetical protein M3416_00100 [Acidobacteriota bacterium]|nr:hypothetical protein [Acidobacteriota bacterium]